MTTPVVNQYLRAKIFPLIAGFTHRLELEAAWCRVDTDQVLPEDKSGFYHYLLAKNLWMHCKKKRGLNPANVFLLSLPGKPGIVFLLLI